MRFQVLKVPLIEQREAYWEVATYRPFLLNGEPVGVETTITVTFPLNR